MKTMINEPLHACGCCKRELPQSAFYINKRTSKVDCYCRECRKKNSGRHREVDRYMIQTENNASSYPVITRTEDPELRKILIRNALQTVANSIERKRKKMKQQELWEE